MAPRKRTKETDQTSENQVQADSAADAPFDPNSDPATEFDPALFEQQIPTANVQPVAASMRGTAQARTALPDPHAIDQINLGNDSKGPMMRLARSHFHKAVLVQFDVNPGKEITDRLKQDGFRWENRAEVANKRGAWVRPLEPGHEIRTMLDAEKLFRSLGNQIRESKGLEPVGMSGPGAA